MTDKKDTPPKPPEQRRAAESPTEGLKRPHATLDLKATEVSSGSKQEKEQPKSAAQPSGVGIFLNKTAPSKQQANPGDAQTAAARVAAAAAALRHGAVRPTGGDPAKPPFGNAAASPDREDGGAAPGLLSIRTYASHVGAGILGGLVAVIGSQLFVSPRTQAPAANDTALRDVQQKLATLEQMAKGAAAAQPPTNTAQRIAAVEAGLAQLDDINRSLGALRETQANLAERANALQTSLERQAADRDAAGRLDRIDERLGMLSAAANADPQAAARIGQMAQITAKLGELETRIAPAAEANEAAKALAQRLDREMANTRADATRVSQRVDVLRAGSDRLEQSLRALQADVSSVSTGMEKLKSDIQAQLGGTAKATDISSAMAPVAAKIGSLETSLQSMVRAESDRKLNAERIVLSLELANLKRAMDRGGAYAAELDAVRKAAGKSLDLSSLERYQHDGVPTSADLAREFRGVANAVLDADAEQPGASLVDRLLYGARTIVRVRKVTHSADDTSAEAIVGRMETAAQENRIGDALAEAKRLSARAAIPAQDWLRKAQARQSVDVALARIDADLKTSLAGAAGQKGGGQ